LAGCIKPYKQQEDNDYIGGKQHPIKGAEQNFRLSWLSA